ncbi:hypothetical protein [Olivibacter domesticus]|uniref:hypothetical protein n=1 Tax=Olivibacter domesticus TaxID=407022 RepID=UPI0011141855|nr:hypothetical protein [Olivibacter domesticus]
MFYARAAFCSYHERELPIALLRQQDQELDKWFREPTTFDRKNQPPAYTPLPPDYQPILIGTKPVEDGLENRNGVIYGFSTIASALISGASTIRAYLPEGSTLLRTLWEQPNESTKISGEQIAREINNRSTEYNYLMEDSLLVAGVHSRNYVEREISINLLRKQDSALENWLNDPLEVAPADLKPFHTPLFPGYTPILIGTKNYWGDEEMVDAVVDGFARIASALISGHDTIRAYVPDDSLLLKEDLMRLDEHCIIPGGVIAAQIKCMDAEPFCELDAFLDFFRLKEQQYIRMEFPINLLCKEDEMVNRWLDHPLSKPNLNTPAHWPPSSGYTPILLDTAGVEGSANCKAVVTNGFYRISNALHAGNTRIDAYVPAGSSLIPKALQFLQEEKQGEQLNRRKNKGNHL